MRGDRVLTKYALEYYGLQDLATGHYIQKIVDDLKNNPSYINSLVNLVEEENESIQYYENILKVRVILEYESLMEHINSEEVHETLNQLFKGLRINRINKDIIKEKIRRYINQNAINIFREDNYSMIKQTFKIGLTFAGGINSWHEIISHSNKYTLMNFFDDLYQFLKKKRNNDLLNYLLDKVLFPISTQRLGDQISMAIKIRKDFKEVFSKYQKELLLFFSSLEFEALSNIEQVKMIRDTLGRRLLGIEGELKLKKKLTDAEEIMNNQLSESGIEFELTSKEFSELEKQFDDFREKLYLLTFKEFFSIYQIMQYQDKQTFTLLDLASNMEGIVHEKYGNPAFSIKFHHFETLMVLETAYLISRYEAEFWEGLLELVKDVEGFSGIGKFLIYDTKKLEKLVNENEFFIASTLLVQIIERLLRELLLKILYGVTDILKEAKYKLGDMLNMSEKSVLRKIFTAEEIETLDYFLINDEYGLNLRNRLAHYNIESNEVGLEYFARLLHILIFILIKIDYQGIIFEE